MRTFAISPLTRKWAEMRPHATVLRAAPFVSHLAPANRARPIQAGRTAIPAFASAAGLIQRPQVRSRSKRCGFLFIPFHLFRLLMQLRRSHTHQQRELGPRLKSAFLNTFLCFSTALRPANLLAHTAMGNRRVLHVTSPRIESRFETLELRFPLMKKKKATNRDGPCIQAR